MKQLLQTSQLSKWKPNRRKGICGYGQLEKATELAARVRRANGKAEKQSLSDRKAKLPELLFETLAGLHLEYHIQLRLAFV